MLRDIASGSASSPSHSALQTVADVDRLILRLFMLWNVPRIEVHLHTLPALHVQHTQQRLDTLQERTIGSWGEIAAGVMLLAGFIHAWNQWTSAQQWRQLGYVLIATAATWLAGQLLESAWRRMRLIWALWRLRRQLVTGKGLYAGSTQVPFHSEYDSVVPEPVGAAAAASVAASAARNSIDPYADAAGPDARRALIARPSDVVRLLWRLLVPWRLPRIELQTAGLPGVDLQRIQHRITLLCGSCNCVLGALLATMTLLAGSFYIVLSTSRDWAWPRDYWDSRPGMLLALGVVGAGVVGWLIETVMTRTRLAAVLLHLRGRLRAQAERVT
ncbi:MAG TPA: hypothetical protein VNQ32_01005 [Steroidobacteraceae bacterium]|nr:hypothetical protein [Steroidobacteraceae bacterium]